MAKETFVRSKPHVNIGTVGGSSGSASADFGFLTDAGAISVIDYEDDNGDGLVTANLGDHTATLCIAPGGASRVCVDARPPSGGFAWSTFRLPLFDTGGPGPAALLATIDLAQVGANPPSFEIGRTFAVMDGRIGAWPELAIRESAPLSAILADPFQPPPTHTGSARVVGFAEFVVPEPATAMLFAVASVGLLVRRRRLKARRPRAASRPAPTR